MLSVFFKMLSALIYIYSIFTLVTCAFCVIFFKNILFSLTYMWCVSPCIYVHTYVQMPTETKRGH